MSNVRFSKKSNGLCDFCADTRETIGGLSTNTDVASRVRLIRLEPSLHNHIISHRMGRHLYRTCIAKAKGLTRSTDLLESDTSFIESTGCEDAPESFEEGVIAALSKNSTESLLESEVSFNVEPPFEWSDDGVSVISLDYARHLSILHKAEEKTNESLAYTLGYNIYKCLALLMNPLVLNIVFFTAKRTIPNLHTMSQVYCSTI